MSTKSSYPSPSFRLVAVIALFVGIGAGAFAFFSFLLPSISDDGKTVYIQADKSPIKVPPDQPGGMEIPHQDKLVFNAVTNPNAKPNLPERVAPPPEQPVYGSAGVPSLPQPGPTAVTVADATPSVPAPSAGQTDAPPSKAPTTEQPVAGTSPLPAAPAPKPAAAPPVVEVPAPVAMGRAIQPVAPAKAVVAKQAVKGPPAASFDVVKGDVPPPPAKPGKSIKTAAGVPVKSASAAKEAKPQVAKAEQEAVFQPAPVEPQVASADLPPPAKVVEAKPEANGLPQAITPPTNQVVAVEAPASPTAAEHPLMAAVPAPAAPAKSGGVKFQLASATDRASAERAVKAMNAKYGSALGGLTLSVATATVKGHQVFRVQGGAASKTDALNICSKVKSQGGACVLSR